MVGPGTDWDMVEETGETEAEPAQEPPKRGLGAGTRAARGRAARLGSGATGAGLGSGVRGQAAGDGGWGGQGAGGGGGQGAGAAKGMQGGAAAGQGAPSHAAQVPASKKVAKIKRNLGL